MTTAELRYADGPTTEASRIIDAPPERLWELVTDIQLPADYSNEFQGAEWLDGATEVELGARFLGTNENERIGRWQVTCTIVECEPGRSYGWVVGDVDEPAAAWRFELEPVEGGTRVTQRVRLGPGRSGLSPAIERMPDREHDIIVRRLDNLRSNMEANLAGFAELAAAG